jgi:Protein of unknown function (DUF4199)
MQQTAIKYGIITGIAMALYLFVFHQIDRTLAINPLVNLGSLVFLMVGMMVSTKRQVENNGGSLTKKEALKNCFAITVISGLFFYGFMFLLFKTIDPGLNDLLLQRAQELDPKLKVKTFEMTLGTIFKGYISSLLYGFLLSMMVSSFMKK